MAQPLLIRKTFWPTGASSRGGTSASSGSCIRNRCTHTRSDVPTGDGAAGQRAPSGPTDEHRIARVSAVAGGVEAIDVRDEIWAARTPAGDLAVVRGRSIGADLDVAPGRAVATHAMKAHRVTPCSVTGDSDVVIC